VSPFQFRVPNDTRLKAAKVVFRLLLMTSTPLGCCTRPGAQSTGDIFFNLLELGFGFEVWHSWYAMFL